MSLTPTMSLPRALTSSSRSAAAGCNCGKQHGRHGSGGFREAFHGFGSPAGTAKACHGGRPPTSAAPATSPAAEQGCVGRPVNLPLGLTFYCSTLVRRRQPPRTGQGLRAMHRPPRASPRFRGGRVALAGGGCSTTPVHRPTPPDRSAPTPRRAPRPSGGRRWNHGAQRYRANPARRRGRGPLRPGVARHRPARAGRRRARTGRDPQSAIPRGARRLWPRARRQRQLQAGARGAQPRAHARTSPTGASCRCRARCSTRWAATTKRSAIMPAR